MPEIKHWREDPEEELARLIPTNEMTNFWSSNIDIIVNPGETAVIMREGEIVEVLTQQRLQSIAGGFTNWLGEKLKAKSKFDLLMVDNKPFQIEIGAEGLTMDNVAQTGTAKLTLRLNHENSGRILGVLREKAIKVKKGFFRKKEVTTGYETVLTRTSIEQMIAEEAQAKVFKKIIAKYPAKDLGGSSAVDEEVAVSSRIELNKTLETWGMNVENIFVDWSTNAYQAWKAQRAPATWAKQAQMEERDQDETLDFELAKKRKLRERELQKMDREFDDDDEFADLSKRQKQLEMKKQIALEEARMEAELAEIKAGSKANVQGIESKSDVDELQGMLSVKEQMAQQKMARKAQEQQHELEMARIKADVDKSVGVAQAEAKAQVLKRKFESEDSKKNEKNRS
ncbi:MAG TPA: hypothetical protein DCL76_00120 [Chloroflexi bacterium]|nr:hypothetical protein [Chloroflexota bacterium]|tara:strand:+ start:2941 stop:4134 length:1194 start_codon:yes stop_codon:yes gene_type:complete